MQGRMSGWMAAALAGLALVAIAPAPAAADATAAPSVRYAGGATLSCVLVPNLLNVVGQIPAALSATGPAYAVAGGNVSLTDASLVLPLPGPWITSFGRIGVNVLAGDVDALSIDGTGVAPDAIDPAAQPPYSGLDVLEFNQLRPALASPGAGLPFGPAVLSTYPDLPGDYGPLELNAPVTTQNETDTVGTPTWNPPITPPVQWDAPTGTPAAFTIGPITVTGSAGQTVGLAFDTTTGAQRIVIGGYDFADTAAPSVEQYGDPPTTPSHLVLGPAPTSCTAPAASSIASLPIVAAPAVTAQPHDVTVPRGSAVTLTAAGAGTPAPTVQWQSEPRGDATFSDIAGATSDSLTVGAPADGTRYRAVFTVAVSNPAAEPSGPFTVGTATSDAATVTVSSPTPRHLWWWWLWQWLVSMFG